jgi:predicted PolB exonuclease-like 3'-5' exonuclease
VTSSNPAPEDKAAELSPADKALLEKVNKIASGIRLLNVILVMILIIVILVFLLNNGNWSYMAKVIFYTQVFGLLAGILGLNRAGTAVKRGHTSILNVITLICILISALFGVGMLILLNHYDNDRRVLLIGMVLMGLPLLCSFQFMADRRLLMKIKKKGLWEHQFGQCESGALHGSSSASLFVCLLLVVGAVTKPKSQTAVAKAPSAAASPQDDTRATSVVSQVKPEVEHYRKLMKLLATHDVEILKELELSSDMFKTTTQRKPDFERAISEYNQLKEKYHAYFNHVKQSGILTGKLKQIIFQYERYEQILHDFIKLSKEFASIDDEQIKDFDMPQMQDRLMKLMNKIMDFSQQRLFLLNDLMSYAQSRGLSAPVKLIASDTFDNLLGLPDLREQSDEQLYKAFNKVRESELKLYHQLISLLKMHDVKIYGAVLNALKTEQKDSSQIRHLNLPKDIVDQFEQMDKSRKLITKNDRAPGEMWLFATHFGSYIDDMRYCVENIDSSFFPNIRLGSSSLQTVQDHHASMLRELSQFARRHDLPDPYLSIGYSTSSQTTVARTYNAPQTQTRVPTQSPQDKQKADELKLYHGVMSLLKTYEMKWIKKVSGEVKEAAMTYEEVLVFPNRIYTEFDQIEKKYKTLVDGMQNRGDMRIALAHFEQYLTVMGVALKQAKQSRKITHSLMENFMSAMSKHSDLTGELYDFAEAKGLPNPIPELSAAAE